MSVVDGRGRLFGRINLVDALVAGFIIVLIPIAYATFLLFRPSRPQIHSVTLAEVNREDRRIGIGSNLTAKLKVQGTGLNPMLRASIGSTPALGFVFENPNSADVLVGVIPMGTHDLVLYDGVQEVARAVGAVTIKAVTGTMIRAVGWFTALDSTTSKMLVKGFGPEKEAPAAFEVVEVGPERPGRSRLRVGDAPTDLPASGWIEREAVLLIRCDAPAIQNNCALAGVSVNTRPPVQVTIGGSMAFEISELLPTADPTAAHVRVRFDGPQVGLIQTGDRDRLLDTRAARVSSIGGREGSATTATLELGADDSREGWRYRGQLLRPGAAFRLTTDRYDAEGIIVGVEMASPRGAQ